jgi:biopolymer transport protein ExbD
MAVQNNDGFILIFFSFFIAQVNFLNHTVKIIKLPKASPQETDKKPREKPREKSV